MKMTNQEYGKYVSGIRPKTKLLGRSVWAFCVGGGICAIGQGFYNLYEYIGLSEKNVAALVPVTLIFLAALTTAIGVYDDLAKYAGAGALVPITGFSNAMVSPAMEFRSEGLILGMAAKMFTIAGPVLVFGISASVLYGLVLSVIYCISPI